MLNLTQTESILNTITNHGRADSLTIADLEAYKTTERDWATLATQVDARTRGKVKHLRDLARSYLTRVWKNI